MGHAAFPQEKEHKWEQVDESRWEKPDVWGNTWARTELYSKGEVVRGVIDDWAMLDSYKIPDFLPAALYRDAKARFELPENGKKFKLGMLPGFIFSLARKLRKMELYLADLIAARENVDRLHEMLKTQLFAAIENFAAVGAQGIFFCEDWGTQRALLISPAMWREIFKPYFVDMCRLAHGHNMKVLMHSCGYNIEIIPDLVEAGVDVLQFDQPQLYGIDRLAEFHGQVTFWCPVDIQKTLQSRDAARIERDAKEMIEKLGAGGGFIAGYYYGDEAIGLEPKWQDIACRAFVKHGQPDFDLSKVPAVV